MAAPKIDANRGDVFEACFAAAVAARFVKRAKTKKTPLPKITITDADAVLAEIMKKGYVKNVNDVGSAVMDTVTVNVSIPRKAEVFLQNQLNWADIRDLRQGAVNFAILSQFLLLVRKIRREQRQTLKYKFSHPRIPKSSLGM